MDAHLGPLLRRRQKMGGTRVVSMDGGWRMWTAARLPVLREP